MKEKEETILKDPVVAFIRGSWEKSNFNTHLFLTGGAVIDLLEGRKPKDYDFAVNSFNLKCLISKGVDAGLVFNYTSATAVSFKWEGKDIQILRRPIDKFPFTIEMSKFCMKKGKFDYFDEVSFNNKVLIPNDTLVTDNLSITKTAFLDRISKWESKGYKIHPITKTSYGKLTKQKTFLQKIRRFLFINESNES